MKWRHEIKQIIGPAEYLLLAKRLDAIFSADSHADAHGEYRVRSLYFDDPFDTALRDKTDGLRLREKFRLRCYNEDFTAVRLEKKMKQGGLCAKQSAKLTREEAGRLLAGDIDFLLQKGEGLPAEFYAKMRGRLLRPKTIVEYRRRPYVYPAGNTRITLDSDIRSGLYSRDFFRDKPLYLPADAARAVLEVKYDEFLPELAAKAVQLGGGGAAAYSKYAMSRRFD